MTLRGLSGLGCAWSWTALLGAVSEDTLLAPAAASQGDTDKLVPAVPIGALVKAAKPPDANFQHCISSAPSQDIDSAVLVLNVLASKVTPGQTELLESLVAHGSLFCFVLFSVCLLNTAQPFYITLQSYIKSRRG